MSLTVCGVLLFQFCFAYVCVSRLIQSISSSISWSSVKYEEKQKHVGNLVYRVIFTPPPPHFWDWVPNLVSWKTSSSILIQSTILIRVADHRSVEAHVTDPLLKHHPITHSSPPFLPVKQRTAYLDNYEQTKAQQSFGVLGECSACLLHRFLLDFMQKGDFSFLAIFVTLASKRELKEQIYPLGLFSSVHKCPGQASVSE